MTIEIKLLHPNARMPVKATDGSAGYGLTSAVSEDIYQDETLLIN